MGFLKHLAHAICLLSPALASAAVSGGEYKLARDYVFAACLVERYKGSPLEAEAQTWAGGLIEAGNLPAEAYPVLAKLASRAPAASLEPNGVTLRIPGCVDLIHDKRFESLLKKTLTPFLR
ncbi:hypothetical protein V8J88_06380 [Massilia sp. W12]|uniref:hypothetical protein n=1 Tax=Massilia sp. W12 TaxID=3126507 RepID=UPI0030D26E33